MVHSVVELTRQSSDSVMLVRIHSRLVLRIMAGATLVLQFIAYNASSSKNIPELVRIYYAEILVSNLRRHAVA
jgi:hypothetical protein